MADETPPVQWKRVFGEGILLYKACPLLAAGYVVLYLLREGGGLVGAQLVGAITGAVSRQGAGPAPNTGDSAAALLSNFWLWAGLGLTLLMLALPSRYVSEKMDAAMSKTLRDRLFRSVLRQPPGFFHQRSPGQLAMVINQFTIETQMTLRQAIMEPLLQLVMIVATSGLLVYNFLELQSNQEISVFGIILPVPALLLIVLVLALCSPWFISMMSRRIRLSSAALRDRGLALAGLVTGAMQSPEEIQAMNAERFFAKKHRENVGRYVNTRVRQSLVMEIVNLLNALPAWLIPTLLLGLAVLLTIRATGTTDVGNLVAIFILAPQLISPVQSLSSYLVMVGSAWPGVHQVLDLLDSAPPPPEDEPAAAPPIATPSLEVRSLRFSYGPGLPPVFDDLSFSLEPERITGLVARMGQGKTTFFRLALKFYTPDGGDIRLGGRSLDDFSIAAVRRHIALMSQFPAFFHDTVRENLLMARPDTTDEELLETCRLTGILDILRTKLGDHPLDAPFAAGRRLSGGQCKLFALTRCLLRDPDYVFLDEPTTGMDNTEKYALIPQLRQAARGKTVVAVDHDLPWMLRFCDTFLVLDRGRIAESGTGEALLAKGGIFAELHRHTQQQAGENTSP